MYSDIVQISKSIERSINLEFDLHNSEKINNYIPTKSSCEVIKAYFKTALGYDTNNSKTLLGPYGKGKSHLMLVLAELLNSDNYPQIDNLLNRIKEIDIELFELIEQFKAQNIRLLPVVIQSGYENLSQAFLISLKTALSRENIDIDRDDTFFEACTSLLNEWKINHPNLKEKAEIILAEKGLSLEELEDQLNHYSQNGLEEFLDLYRILTYGVEFNPLSSKDPIQVYKRTIRSLNQIGYSGLFIIFDEFSKSISGDSLEVAKRLKIIQDFAELANRSVDNEKILFTCITHKSLDLYSQGTQDVVRDAFKTVEGRFTEIRLRRTFQESLQLIALSLIKLGDYSQVRNLYWDTHKELLDTILKTGVLSEDELKYLQEKAFPMNPLAVLLLVDLSELIAQNERTIFTALADNEHGSLQNFLENNKTELYSADLIYDYFSAQYRDTDDPFSLFFEKGNAALGVLNDSEETKIVKAITLLHMLKETSTFRANTDQISALVGKEESLTSLTIQKLINDGILTEDYLDNTLEVASEDRSRLENRISTLRKKNISWEKLSELLASVTEEQFYIPHKYNFNYKMTRFFKAVDIEIETLISNSFRSLVSQKGIADGYVLNVYCDYIDEKTITQISEKMIAEELTSSFVRVIPVSRGKLLADLITLDAIITAIESNKFNQLSINQLQAMKNQLSIKIKNEISKAKAVSIILSYVEEVQQGKGDLFSLEERLSSLTETLYYKTPIINNEMVNRHQVNATYSKAVSYFIDELLKGNIHHRILEKSPSGPEATTFYSLFKNGELNSSVINVVEHITDYLTVERDGNQIQVNALIKELVSPPFGIREGVLPILLALAFDHLPGYPFLYFKDKQVILNADNLSKLIKSPDNYSLKIAENSKQNLDYLKSILVCENISRDEIAQLNFYEKVNRAVDEMKKRINQLPMIIRESSLKNNYLQLPEKFIRFKNQIRKFDINPYDFVFSFLYEMTAGLETEIRNLIRVSERYEPYITEFESKIIDDILKIFESKSGSSIKEAYHHWKEIHDLSKSQIILEGKMQRLKNEFENAGYDNSTLLNQISVLFTGYSIKDWSTDYSQTIINSVNKFVEETLASNVSSKPEMELCHDANNLSTEITPFGSLLQNALMSSISEFGESVSNNEKIFILRKLMDTIINGE